MEKTDTYGKDGNKALKSEIFSRGSHRAQPVLHILYVIQNIRLSASLGRTEKRTTDLSNIPKCSPMAWGLLMRFIGMPPELLSDCC